MATVFDVTTKIVTIPVITKRVMTSGADNVKAVNRHFYGVNDVLANEIKMIFGNSRQRGHSRTCCNLHSTRENFSMIYMIRIGKLAYNCSFTPKS